MAEIVHGVFRSDLMSGTDVAADLVSVKYLGADGKTPSAIDNGCVVKLDGLISGEREVWCGKTPAANTPLSDIVIIGTPEVMYDERKKNLDEFVKYDKIRKKDTIVVHLTKNIRRRPDKEDLIADLAQTLE